jgi:colicin import membrane protein
MLRRITRIGWRAAIAGTLAGFWLASGAAETAWQPPADSLFTESELKAYIDTAADWAQQCAKITQSVSSAPAQAAKIAAVSNIGDQEKACIEKHGLNQAEYQWLANRSMDAYSAVVFVDDSYGKMQADLQDRSKENDVRMADAQKRMAIYESAQKDGRRVMTSQDRDDAIKAALAERQEALDEIKQHDDDAKADEAEAKQHDDEAAAANDLADNPPADVSADDRADYVQNEKNAAQAAEDAAKEARDREADAQKASADAAARADAAGKRATDPELPETDDDKASISAENDAAIQQAQSEINRCQEANGQLATVATSLKQSMDQLNAKVPARNMDLMRKYRGQYEAIFRQSSVPASQPSQ